MRRFEAQEAFLPPGFLAHYAKAVQKLRAREDRFSSRVLLSFMAAASEGFEVRAAGDVTEILLYDEIGYWGVTAKEFVLALAAAGPGPIRLRINSPGGDTFDGLAIYNALRARTAPVTVVVDGIAASAASFIAMAGQRVEMPEQAMLMIHNCWGICIGNRNDMLDMAAIQEKIDGQMAQIYAGKCGKPVAEMTAAMDAESYYTSAEAQALGLCDAIVTPPATAAVLAAPKSGATRMAALVRPRADALPPYDPDGDGDNDAAEALTLIGAAMDILRNAAGALSGGDEDADDDTGETAAMPIVPGAAQAAAASAADPAAADLRARRNRLRLAQADAA
jgi:ATP-dependent Clp endopeptidase proteolytic subunit ClpP